MKTKPKYIEAYLTMRCNLKCSYCLNKFGKVKTSALGELTGDQWVESLNKHDFGGTPVTLGGGEPSLHRDFIYIINNLKHSVDILTNLNWSDSFISRFIIEVDPARLKRDSPYPNVRISYHPSQLSIQLLTERAKVLQDAGFSIGIWAVLYPSPDHLSKINQAQFVCRELGIDFRLKEYVGQYNGEWYGDYSKYPDAVKGVVGRIVQCKFHELIISPDGFEFKCHADMYARRTPISNITRPWWKWEEKFRECKAYGSCHACDVKSKTDSKQRLNYQSVDIIFENE